MQICCSYFFSQFHRAFKVSLSGLAIAFGMTTNAYAQQAFGPWHGGYAIKSGSKDIEITLNLDQLKGGRAGQAELSIFALKAKPKCPRSLHPAFCDELAKRFSSGDRLAFDIKTAGIRYTKKRAVIAFRFADERPSRLLILDREAGSRSNHWARLIHYARGVDLVGRARETKHLCQLAMCGPDRLKELVERPKQMLGVLADKGFARNYPIKKDKRKQAWANRAGGKQTAGQQTSGQGVSPYRPAQPNNTSSYMFGLTGFWHLTSQNGKALGKLRFNRQSNGAVMGSGLLAAKRGGSQQDVAISLVRAGPSALDFSLGFVGQRQGKPRLLLSLGNGASNQLGGTLIQNDSWYVVRLTRENAAAQPFDQSSGMTSNPSDFAAEEPIEGDMPGTGVTGPAYRMRNVPEGRQLAVRSAPDRSASSVGTLPWNASEILVLGCKPNINPVAFDRADLGTKRRFLARGWCEIEHEGLRGHVIGIYLDPILGR
ncbi:MAG: hypothetical protein N4A65_00745 [Cohaesibacter sp.]|nr:hypothetical protein [Cohaesibacter sp.]